MSKRNDTIDRRALVTRHNIQWNDPHGVVPVGNGEFCFGADGTGLQTFAGNTMSHWAWHSFPLPDGFTPADVPASGNPDRGRIAGPMQVPQGKERLFEWMFQNPHPLNLCRLRLARADGGELKPEAISDLRRSLDLWTGMHASEFRIAGQPVRVQTCVHPVLDAVAVRIESPLVALGQLEVSLDLPYPPQKAQGPWVGDFSAGGGQTTILRQSAGRVDLRRVVHDTCYHIAVAGGAGLLLRPKPAGAASGPASWRLSAGQSGVLELVCAFSAAAPAGELPDFNRTQAAAGEHWHRFWTTGGAVDLSASRDERWRELERRIVLSQYLMAAQSAGSWPSAETGLLGMDGWYSQFHMEMTWWHIAHYALWDRWHLAARQLECYQRFLPMARKLAGEFGYRGAKWGKMVGPEGRTAPWMGSFILHWQQPHPIFFAELEYRLQPTAATLEKWKDIVFATAEYMADFPTLDAATGRLSLVPIMPPSEQGVTRDTVFDLAYWRWGLDAAQTWLQRLGLARDVRWDQVRRNLQPLPVADDVFMHSAEWHDTYTTRAWEHPDPVGVLGMLPPMEGVDASTAKRTVRRVADVWDWKRCWGWDFPWMAMAAARTGQPQLAVDMLLKDAAERNAYDPRGANTGGPCPYLPGNGGLLYAVAMMAAGWDGAPARNAPGFPNDGQWTVRWEGLRPAP